MWKSAFSTLLIAAAVPACAAEAPFYIGTYTGQGSEGIYRSTLNLETGAIAKPELAVEAENPSFLAIHPSGAFLYAVNELGTFEGEKAGAVSAFAIDESTGALRLLNQQSSAGGYPCHLITDHEGKNVLAANYGGGNLVAFPIRRDGTLGARSALVQHTGSSVNPNRQKEPHAHSINLDSAGRYAIAADLGVDKVFVYKFDSSQGTLTLNDPPSISMKPGAGPRHFAFGAGSSAFVLNELDSTLTFLSFDAGSGSFKVLETVSILPNDFSGNNSAAEVRVHPSGKFVYASNRGHNSIAVFSYDEPSSRLTLVEIESTQGRTPRNFNLDPSGRYLLAANQDSNSIVSFSVDLQTGALMPTGHKVETPRPVCIRFAGTK